ncbi:16S rRNA (guanine(527)-N(7))-methyltransferase RsmG [Pasteurella multocida]|uniref:16S rRNA (guanine(527)-N(7))-methyltransferase RsmG n=1 Tax=Pasteurella multocida TaxID=747 RepID=UPI000998FF20|nr:16S rRNA (guanine(527)-N(7))-methyltransferase RsmG [Pasteurella multocida]ARA69993.1 16S rRNA (guanine(527)-N(7))-methyltransferase RsmG [Pasteurella multocida subsp. multocida]MCL7756563.1 16S rRNA (guanine(527)-N(7))-methyltransferase RsmG [Pasteurella multocida]MCL7780645.1 16S rRNA (guanine(527)-N(7))-methyltransferase RsmG [Pasteurella multocida]OPC89736.1 16S rRNA (guanine(527)-N(7))-methyltransferase RsmG [Pasteurella multocida subsp. septica]OPD01220.1 16S rRNA (guanine(527)-N(7))-
MTNLEQQLSQKLEILLKQTALSITDQQKEQLIKLVLLLNKWNKAYNLTSVRDPMEMLVKHILDSLGKRISFIRNAIRELGLDNVEAVLSRVEEYHPEQPFDGVLSRAFASLKDMTDWCQHLPKQDGYFYALKGLYHQEEVEELSEKFTIQQVIRLQVPELIGERHLVIVK